VSEYFLNGTSAHKRLFRATEVIMKVKMNIKNNIISRSQNKDIWDLHKANRLASNIFIFYLFFDIGIKNTTGN